MVQMKTQSPTVDAEWMWVLSRCIRCYYYITIITFHLFLIAVNFFSIALFERIHMKKHQTRFGFWLFTRSKSIRISLCSVDLLCGAGWAWRMLFMSACWDWATEVIAEISQIKWCHVGLVSPISQCTCFCSHN